MSGSDSGIEGPRYAGTESGDARVGELSWLGNRRLAREVGKGHEEVAPPGSTLDVG